jgi:hypothetical protein
MTRRLFWLAMGVTIGALVVRRFSRMMERLTARGIAGSVGAGLSDLSGSVRDFAVEVREAMHEREAQLRAGAGLDGTLGRTDRMGDEV